MRVAALLASLTVIGAGVEPSVKDVMHRVTGYVESYGAKASVVVATERYTQTVTGALAIGPDRREIVADFAIVRTQGHREPWLGFRDVVAVDGRTIHDREGRLMRLLTGPSGGLDEAARLSQESSRFNIGLLVRTFNVPTTALFFFTEESRERFRFSRTRVADGTWELAFREVQRPTLVRTPDGRSVASVGTLWVKPEDGTIVRTRLRFTQEGTGARGIADISVTYRLVDSVGLWLPVMMTEFYEGSRGADRETVTSHAEYSDYRIFTTSGRIK